MKYLVFISYIGSHNSLMAWKYSFACKYVKTTMHSSGIHTVHVGRHGIMGVSVPFDREPPFTETSSPPPTETLTPKETWDQAQRTPRRNMGKGSLKGSDIIQRIPLPPLDKMTGTHFPTTSIVNALENDIRRRPAQYGTISKPGT